MRLGVLDVGSNTVHLLVVDAHRGGQPSPAASVKTDLQLAALLSPDGTLAPSGERRLTAAVAEARREAEERGVEDLVAFATSAIRDAPNGPAVVERVRAATGVDLNVLEGADEAALTFIAVRRWYGWSAGRLLVADIGGGSLEVAEGDHEEPDLAVSFPLGAGRLHREFLSGHDPARPDDVDALRSHVRSSLAPLAERGTPPPDLAAATSKTFRSLARIAGAAPYARGARARRRLALDDVRGIVAHLLPTTAAERATLPGVSPARAPQLLAGAVVAEQVMETLGVASFAICPWALREGVILRRLDWLAGV
ncbi:MAG: exopolyphosphatase / guanosine-5-triphosphate,3-diphosphate pyrophosphatase [Frankiaceae bacterium]|nr:exopolyphosphatase / guanosine-5-triphosphate,3-diphosphate pyrophosphatase [Frankiaceae bacterium]